MAEAKKTPHFRQHMKCPGFFVEEIGFWKLVATDAVFFSQYFALANQLIFRGLSAPDEKQQQWYQDGLKLGK